MLPNHVQAFQDRLNLELSRACGAFPALQTKVAEFHPASRTSTDCLVETVEGETLPFMARWWRVPEDPMSLDVVVEAYVSQLEIWMAEHSWRGSRSRNPSATGPTGDVN